MGVLIINYFYTIARVTANRLNIDITMERDMKKGEIVTVTAKPSPIMFCGGISCTTSGNLSISRNGRDASTNDRTYT